MILELIAVTISGLTYLESRKCAESKAGPYDGKPEGTSETAFGFNDVFGASQAKYRVTSFPRGADQFYHVAVRRSNSDWICFVTDTRTGARVFWRASASRQAGMDILRKDFVV